MRSTTLSLMALLALGACTKVGPDFVTPPAPVQESWLEKDERGVKTEPADISTWWQVFEDPVLTELIDIAVNQNLSLQATGLRVLEARAALGIAVGLQYPQTQDIVAGYTYNWTSDNAANNDFNDKTFESLGTGIDTTLEIDFWGKFARAIESSDANLGATIADYQDALVILTADVATAYVSTREAEERIRLAKANTEVQREALRIADTRFKNGAVTELDVQQARALLAETESTIPFLEIKRRQSQHALAVLLGITPRELIQTMGGEGQIPTAPEEVAIGIPNELLRRRPDIRRAELQAASQSAQIGVARAQLFPAFSLGGFVGLQTSASVDSRSNNASLSDLFKGDSFSGFLGPSISWPFLNYGRLTNNVRVQDARFQSLVADYQNTVLEAYQDVEDGLVGFLRSKEQTGFLATSVKASQRSVELALLQYVEGIADYTRVLATQDDLLERQDQLAIAQSAIALNLIVSYRGLGGGWQIRGPNDFVPPETIEAMRERTDWGDVLPASDLQDAPDSGEAVAETDTYFRSPDW